MRLNGNFDASFPLARLDQRDNFLSLLHYFGLLSIGETVAGMVRLHIPNWTMRQLLYGHLRSARSTRPFHWGRRGRRTWSSMPSFWQASAGRRRFI